MHNRAYCGAAMPRVQGVSLGRASSPYRQVRFRCSRSRNAPATGPGGPSLRHGGEQGGLKGPSRKPESGPASIIWPGRAARWTISANASCTNLSRRSGVPSVPCVAAVVEQPAFMQDWQERDEVFEAAGEPLTDPCLRDRMPATLDAPPYPLNVSFRRIQSDIPAH